MKKEFRLSELQKVRRWNQRYPQGTAVRVYLDCTDRSNFSFIDTHTRSEAFMLGASHNNPGHTAVIMLADISGAYLLDRVVPL